MFENKDEKQARKQILDLISEYCSKYHQKRSTGDDQERIPYATRVYNSDEMVNLVDSALDFWLTSGRYTEDFENSFSAFLGVKYCTLVNSGSSANLIAFMALTSPLLGKRAIKRGDEVITVACGFPTTVAPIIQYGAVPVFTDVTMPQYNIDTSVLEKSLSDKTKAVILAHTLGNPFDLSTVKDFCKKYDLWLIEDNCDALGSKYIIGDVEKFTGTIGDIGTSSFYPPHHITMGEGGAVYTNNPLLNKIIRSLRDWGRDCICPPGTDNRCGQRFNRQYGDLPYGYDHKYVYSHFGYNLKVTDMQAAVGCAQLKKLPAFIDARKNNWNKIRSELDDLSDVFILPERAPCSDPSWFGFVLTVRDSSLFCRDDIVNYLEAREIQTRMLFAGNLTKHPCFDALRSSQEGYRIIGGLENTDKVMKDAFWLGVYPGLTEVMIDKIISSVKGFVAMKRRSHNGYYRTQ